MIKTILKVITKWLWIYVACIVVCAIVVFGFFNHSTHPNDQVAFVIAIPIVIAYLEIRLSPFLRPFQSHNIESEPSVKNHKPMDWTMLSSMIFLLLSLIILFFSGTMVVSAIIYFLIQLDWANKVTLHNIVLPSLIPFGASFLVFLLLLIVNIVKTHWKQIREQIAQGWDDLCESINEQVVTHNRLSR